ncbi:MAG TPA: hypothetical protein HPP77_01045 [Candidatus Hydrogenedentes bacterium]|nr:hypothetical protein [Candidatus Hydrogenedentota bacterium]HIJ73595.1 hypothetical protein [Candidatus Hydrogenedentota bacterium]
MGSTGKFVGWVVAAVAAVAAIVLGIKLVALRAELDQAQALLETERTQTAKLEPLEEKVAAALAETARLEEELTAAQGHVARLEQRAGAIPDASSSADTAETDEAEAAETGGGDTAESRQEKLIRIQMAAITDMTYAQFFKELKLPDDLKAEVRDILVDGTAESFMLDRRALGQEGVTAKDVRKRQDEAEQALRAKLSQVLNAEELKFWDEYAEVSDQYFYEDLVDGQLVMLAKDLTPENRRFVSEVVAEELVVAFDEYYSSDSPHTLTNYNEAQRMALHRGLDRLVEALDDEQYGHVQGFVAIAEAQFDALAD